MNKTKVKMIELFYILLAILNVVVSIIFGIQYLEYVLFLYILVCLITKKIKADEFLIYALFIPNKYLQFLAIPMYLFSTGNLMSNHLKWREFLFIFYITIVSTVNCLIYRGFIVGTVFQVAVYYFIFALINSFRKKFELRKMLVILDKMFVLQLITSLIEIVYYRQLGDSITGTLISAHYLGIFLMVYLYFVILNWLAKKKVMSIIRVMLILALLVASDAKHVVLIFVFSYLVVRLINRLRIRNKLTLLVSAMTFFVIASVFVLSKNMINWSGTVKKLINIYIYSSQYNKKYEFFLRTFKEMLGLNGFFGFGVGQFGSQISITLSKGIIYDWRPQYSIFHYATIPYANAIKGLMTEWYTIYGISESSMVLGYPLVSFIGLLAELGIIGYIWLLQIFDRRFRHSDITFLLAFFMLTIFDTYFEIPCVFVLILIATFANGEGKNNLEVKYNKQKFAREFSIK